MNTNVGIHINVQVNRHLHDAYLESLRAKRAGSGREDRAEYDRLIAEAENLRYDPGELAALLVGRAGAGDVRMGEGTCSNPIDAAEWTDEF